MDLEHYFSVFLDQACHARISTPSARLGLTELQFGVIPGLGGIAIIQVEHCLH